MSIYAFLLIFIFQYIYIFFQLKVVTPQTAAEEIREESKPSGPTEATMISDNDLLLSISGDEGVNYRLYII